MTRSCPSKIICFGDSITEGYIVPRKRSYPAVLSRLLGITCINIGVSGDTSKNGLKRLHQLDSYLLPDESVLALLEFGINDFFMAIPKKECKANLAEIAEHVLSAGYKPCLLGFDIDYPGAHGWISLYSELADHFPLPLYPNIFNGLSKRHGDFLPDGLQPSKRGYAKMAGRVLDFLDKNNLIKKV